MNLVKPGANKEFTVQVGEKVALSSENCTAIVSYSTYPSSPAKWYEDHRVSNGSEEIGPFDNTRKVRISVEGPGEVLYKVGVTPVIVTRHDDRIGIGNVNPNNDGGVNASGMGSFDDMEIIKNSSNAAVAIRQTISGGSQSATTDGSGVATEYTTNGLVYGGIGGWVNDSLPGIGMWTQSVSGTPDVFLDFNGNLISRRDLGVGTFEPSTKLHVEEEDTLTSSIVDSYTAAVTLEPQYEVTDGGDHTVTRHNYMNVVSIKESVISGTITVTDAFLARFDDSPGAHDVLDLGSIKLTPGSVDAWLKYNVNGTPYYGPLYTSKTA